MSLLQPLTALSLLQCIVYVLSCGGSPPSPCSWSTCRGEWRNNWSPGISTGRCTGQRRSLHHITSWHNGRGSCPAPSYCYSQTQYRTKCSCQNAYYCPWHAWSNWAGSIQQGSCGRQSRYRNYNQHTNYVIRDNNCNGISSSCGNGQNDYRDYCSCRYVTCALGGWEAWYDISSLADPNHCASQQRKRSYVTTNRYIERVSNCNGIGPQSCPEPVYEQREKVITCAALSIPVHGSWHRDDCSVNRQRCTYQCKLRCDIANGFEMVGDSDTRECKRSGQWSSPWNSYCKDVRPPSIACPQMLTLNNDAGKAMAMVTLPKASASDNSGKAPVVTTSAGADVKEYGIGSHDVVYTAADETGNKAACTLQITVKDVERPRVSTCPSDIKRKTNQNEIRVTWDYPEFVDNYDKPPQHPLRISSNRNPGQLFPWGRYLVNYQASDRAGNSVKCEFYIEVGPVPCTYFEAPEYGIRACNIKAENANGVNYEMTCTIQCKQGYAFADPTTPNTYLCQSDGTWSRLMYGGMVPVPVYPKSQRPWPDCAPKEGVSAAEKSFKFYTGSCQGNDKEALDRIKKNFLEAVKNSPLANTLLCGASEGNDCVLANVKVYCGSKSKRSGDSSPERVVSFEFMIKDGKASSDPKEEAARIQAMMNNLDEFEKYLKQSFPSSPEVSSVHVEGVASLPTCATGKVLQVLEGQGSNLERSICVDCAIGTFYDVSNKTCVKCPEGHYQDHDGQSQCKPCPKGTWTLGAEAKNVTQCLDICEAGEHSARDLSGLSVCLMCAVGTYQHKSRQSSCIQCPSGKTTKAKGAMSLSDCQ